MTALSAEIVQYVSLAAVLGLLVCLIPLFLCHRRVLLAAKPGQLGQLKRALRWSRFDTAETLIEPAGHPDLSRLKTLQTIGYVLIFVLLAVMLIVVGSRER